jgi:hypothetical protein
MIAGMKDGWKTSEFWVTVGTAAWAAFGHFLPAPLQALVVTVVPGVYTIARTVAKVVGTPAPARPTVVAIEKGLTGAP